MPYHAAFKPSFLKDMGKLPRHVRERCQQVIDEIIDDPFDVAARKLGGYAHLYRYRLGDYRIVYYLNQREMKILFLLVADRRDIYRHLKHLMS